MCIKRGRWKDTGPTLVLTITFIWQSCLYDQCRTVPYDWCVISVSKLKEDVFLLSKDLKESGHLIKIIVF